MRCIDCTAAFLLYSSMAGMPLETSRNYSLGSSLACCLTCKAAIVVLYLVPRCTYAQ
jgi:hypothetical protein